jgi:hypothetical protein
MITLFAAQHLFSSIPADQSPIRKRGYQTIFHTNALQDKLIRQIEDRCVYEGGEATPIKRQFYWLTDDLYAVSQTVALKELDEFGRKGRYLSHTLVLDQQTFKQFEFCPIDILIQYPFYTNLTDVFKQVKPNSMAIRHVEFKIQPSWRNIALRAKNRWNSESLLQLGRLAWQAPLLYKDHISTAINGTENEIYDCLAILFALAGPHQRRYLSFDTWAEDCNFGPGKYFWLQGFSSGHRGKLSQYVDASACRVFVALSLENTPPYGKWLEKEGLSKSWETNSEYLEWASFLDNCLVNDDSKLAQQFTIPEKFIQIFSAINADLVARAWENHLPTGLSRELMSAFNQAVKNFPSLYLTILAQGITVQDVSVFLFQQLYQLGELPSRPDRSILEKYILEVNDAPVSSLIPFWKKKGEDWAKILSRQPPDDYAFILKCLIQWKELPIGLWEAIVLPHIEIWMGIAGPAISPEEWKDSLDQLSALGDDTLNCLADYVPYFNTKSHQQIAKWLHKYKGNAASLNAIFPKPNRKKFLGLI